MGLSPEFVENHIQRWERHWSGGVYPHRSKWPERLFHHAPLENAVLILQGGYLRSRNDPMNAHPRDVAGAGVIDNRVDAHNFVRLYFRPRNPTQYNIEGIRRPNECRFGPHAHAPVLIMFVLDARSILTLQDVRFSDRNMQINGTETGATEEFFTNIPFEKVYHMGSTTDRSIFEHRCAEVLLPSPAELRPILKWVCCRSAAERETLLFLLGQQAHDWEDCIRVVDDLRVFERQHAFAQEVTITPGGLTFVLNPRYDGSKVDVSIRAWDALGQQVIDFQNESIEPKPPQAKRWLIEQEMSPGTYLVEMQVDGHLAYKARPILEATLF